MHPDGLYWYQPYVLVIFLLPLALFLVAYIKQQRLLKRFADPQFLPWLKPHPQTKKLPALKLLFLFLAWLFLCIALAGPRTIKWLPPSLQQDISTVRVQIDFSQSMRAVDNVSNRIIQSQQQLQSWVNTFPQQLKMALGVYAGQAHRLLIPSNDMNLLEYFIQQLPYFKLPVMGNNLSAAINSETPQNKGDSGPSYLMVFSDGDMDKAALDKAVLSLKTIKDKFRKIIIIGVGGEEAVSIPVQQNQVLTQEGKIIVTRRHSDNLRQLAKAGQGNYYAIEDAQLNKRSLQQLLGIQAPRIADKDSSKVQWNEWFYIPLLLGWLFLLLALMEPQRFSGRDSGRFPGTLSGKTDAAAVNKSSLKLLLLSLLLLLAGCDNKSLLNTFRHVDSMDQQISRALDSGNYKQILVLIQYRKTGHITGALSDYARFTQGVACYRLKDFICARQVFSRLAWNSSNKRLKAEAVFNLANSFFYLGDYEQAQVLYNDAAQQGISEDKIKINLEFARSLAVAIRQTIADIEKTQQRAQWRAATTKLTEKFSDKKADGIFLPSFKKLLDNPVFRQLSQQQQQKLLAQGIKFQLHKSTTNSSQNENFWVLSRQDKQAETTSELYNQLMAYEIGLHYVPEKPLDSEGQRPW